MSGKRKHPNDLTADELRELVWEMSLAALDLAQHLAFTNDMLKAEYREEAYKTAERRAYELCYLTCQDPSIPLTQGIAFFGEHGLEAPSLGSDPV